MSRLITNHIVPEANVEQLVIEATDEPGLGGANHRYDITGFDTDSNPSSTGMGGYKTRFTRLPVVFQNGPLKEAKRNGVTNEAMAAIIIDRLEGFQKGQFACEDNEQALMHFRLGLEILQKRTRDRVARGVEGQLKA